MHKLVLILCFSVLWGYSQEESPSGTIPIGNLNINTFSYPLFIGEERHSSFSLNYPLSEKLEIIVPGFYDTYIFSNRFRTSVSFKRYLTQKVYASSGIEAEFANNKGILPPMPPRIGAIMGLGYDLNPNLLIEGKFNGQLNDSPMGAYGEPLVPTPRVYTLGGKFKF